MSRLDFYARFILRHYKATSLASFLFITLLGLGLANAQFTSELRAYFSKENPQLQQFEALEANFNKQDSVLFLLIPQQGDVYSERFIATLYELTESAWNIPFSRQVLSLTNLPKTAANGDEIISDALVKGKQDWTPDKLEQLKALTVNDPLFKSVVSSHGKAAMVVVPLELPEDDMRASIAVVDAAKALRQDIVNANPEVTMYINGTVYANYNIEKAVVQDMSLLVPATSVMIFLLLMLILRVLSGTMITMSLIGLTAFGTFGLFSWLGIPLTPVSGTVPTTLTVIAVADCIHLLITYYHELALGRPKHRAVTQALKINFVPMLITSVTTAIGLLCLNFSDSPPYRQLGNTVAFGAILAFFLTVVWLPALLLWLPAPKKLLAQHTQQASLPYFRWMEMLGRWILGHHRSVLVGSLMLAVILAMTMFNNKVDDQWDKYFDDSFEITESFREFERYFGGGHFMDFSAGSAHVQGIYDPDYMKELDALTRWLEQQPEVGRVDSLVYRVKLINQVLHDDNPDFYRVPDDRELLSQGILLYELSLPYGMTLNDLINVDRSATRVIAYLKSLSSEEMIAFEKRSAEWASQNAQALMLSEGTGIDLVFGHMAQRNSFKLLNGTLLALVLISAILIYVFRSLKLGLLSLVPNLLPIFAAYGVWGLTNGKIDLALSIVGALGLGVVVDDTVHFLAKYRHARKLLQLSTDDAILYAFKTVGSAMVITTIILSLGFLVLALSHFNPTWNMGVLLAITIAMALLLDILLLPGLLKIFDKDKGFMVSGLNLGSSSESTPDEQNKTDVSASPII